MEYFLTDPGPELEYSDGTITIGSFPDGRIRRVLFWGNGDYGEVSTRENHYLLDSDSDVLEIGGEFNYGRWGGEGYWSFSPPLKYLDFPLEESKVWSTSSVRNWDGNFLNPVTMTATVLGPATVTVEAGEFEVIVVSLNYVYSESPSSDRVEELWLHRQLGQVAGLVSWSGIVSESKSSWGAVKAMFR